MNWKQYLLSSVVLILFSCAPAGSGNQDDDSSYFGDKVQEFTFSFQSEILIPMNLGEPTSKIVRREVQRSIKYALGRMHNDGSLYPSNKVKMISSEVDSFQPEHYRVKYSFSGKGVFAKNLSSYTLYLPLMTRQIYDKALRGGHCHHKDEDQVDIGNFWYQWDPSLPGCDLVENKDYVKVNVKLNPVDDSKETLPEYERLINNKQLNITMFYGTLGKIDSEQDPGLSKDIGAAEYRKMQLFLMGEMGYTITPFIESEMRKIYNPTNPKNLPFGVIATKQTKRGLIRIRLLYLDTHFSHIKAQGFHYFLRESLKNESVVLYNGHSGIGRNLNLANIEEKQGFKIKMNPNYQIIFFGSCMPYGYYTQMYFDRKATDEDSKGTKNLDLLVYGKETYSNNRENYQFIRILTSEMQYAFNFSYKDIVGRSPKGYYGVIGDEDNPVKK
jgi:hypothetical protein